MMRTGIEELDHTADVGLRIRSTNLPSLFLDAATGLFSLVHEGFSMHSEITAPPSDDHETPSLPLPEVRVADLVRVAETPEDCEATTIAVDASRLDHLLHGWLTELLFHHAIQHSLPRSIQLERCDAGQLRAHVAWQRMDADVRSQATEIKAVTWHGLLVEHHEGLWTAEVIFDT